MYFLLKSRVKGENLGPRSQRRDAHVAAHWSLAVVVGEQSTPKGSPLDGVSRAP
jgi:hypothetical protein